MSSPKITRIFGLSVSEELCVGFVTFLGFEFFVFLATGHSRFERFRGCY
jgi:hypothetical protein